MAWKCNTRPSQVTVEPRVKSLCSEVFSYDQKVFFIDYAGNRDDLNEELYLPVMVEAFRTTKELLSMLKEYKPWAVSIWSSDVAEANEIAFGGSSPLVWINDCDSFAGPPKASQVFYSCLHPDLLHCEGNNDVVKKALELRRTWCKKSVAVRIEELRSALKKLQPRSKFIEELLFSFNKSQENISLKDTDKFVEVENGRICVGIEEPAGVVLLDKSCSYNLKMLIDVFVYMVRGNAVVYNPKLSTELLNLLRELERSKLPILEEQPDSFPHWYSIADKTKVVWTNYGTTFAN